MTLQVVSFGTLSKLYSNINDQFLEKRAIASCLGLPARNYVESWMTSLSVLRNLCAHHSRIVNRTFDFPLKKLFTSNYPWIAAQPANNQLLFASCLL